MKKEKNLRKKLMQMADEGLSCSEMVQNGMVFTFD